MVELRPAEDPTDAAACAAIYAPYVTDTVISLEETAPTETEMAARIAKHSANHAWLMAALDGEPVGFAYGSQHRERAAYRWAADVSVYIDRSAQRRGIGRQLYTALLDTLIRRGYYVACAGITLPNDASVALHEAFGFVPVGVYRNIGFKFGAWHDVGWWQRALRRSTSGQPPAEPGIPQESSSSSSASVGQASAARRASGSSSAGTSATSRIG
jgi:phosphinothricin acetyltransferase